MLRNLLRATMVLALFGRCQSQCGSSAQNAERGVSKPVSGAPIRLELVQVVDGLDRPVFLTSDGQDRLLVVEQGGRIRLVEKGVLRAEPWLDVSERVVAGGEQGLLGLALRGDFAWIYFTAKNGDNTLARVRAGKDRADPATVEILLAIPDFAPNHNGGMVAFGPDGFLYLGLGDGGGGGDPQKTAQDKGHLFGKILRLDVSSSEAKYTIPKDNPFVSEPGARGEVFHYGLRNPWRFSFDRKTGDLYIGDVGQSDWEEIDRAPAGAKGLNFGWSHMEGAHCFPASAACSAQGFAAPIAEYDHSFGCSVTGGYVYRGKAIPDLDGVYLFSDFCSGRIWGLDPESLVMKPFLHSTVKPSSFGEDAQGELYVLDHPNGAVYRIDKL